ncbi:hypothetical protein [Nocardia puris]|uniref:hypothetical protein n=1 Tax=Nocardia puris TaxID=208602 RepID=UPI002E205ADD
MGGHDAPSPAGLTILPADEELVAEVVEAVTGATDLPHSLGPRTEYLFAAYSHGYDVARRGDAGWSWGSSVFGHDGPGHPKPGAAEQLERVRVFGTDDELVIARIGDRWRGWWHHHEQEPAIGPLAPRPRSYLVTVGRGLHHRGGFTRIEHGSGQFSVLPYPFARRRGYAHTREYFAADRRTGAVRVAAVTWTGYGTVPRANQQGGER